jgi:hypothetical protein
MMLNVTRSLGDFYHQASAGEIGTKGQGVSGGWGKARGFYHQIKAEGRLGAGAEG